MSANGSGAERRATIGEPAKPGAAAERVRSSDWLGDLAQLVHDSRHWELNLELVKAP